MLNRGVVYTVYGDVEKYMEEACRSLASLRRHHPDISTALVASEPNSLFDICITRKDLPNEAEGFRTEEKYGTKIDLVHLSPFEKTLFLDTDTVVLGDLSYGFQLLEELSIYSLARGLARTGT